MTKMLRGQVWLAQVVEDIGPKLFVIVSENHRNSRLDTAIGVRITSTNKYTELPTTIALPPQERVNGWVRCSDITELWDEDLARDAPITTLSPNTMRSLEPGLASALGFTI